MKKFCLIMVILAFFLFSAFTEEPQEEIDFLLFLPDLGNQFVNEDGAGIQLDNVANYLKTKDLISGQIYVYGYAADVENEVEPVGLSRDRALFVINELQKRGISADFFANPVAYGAVDLWGNNIDEDERSPNRRVRILLEDIILTPAIVQPPEPEPKPEPVIEIKAIENVKAPEKPGFKFPWWIFLFLPLLLIPFLFRRKKRESKPKPVKEKKAPPQPPPPPPVQKTPSPTVIPTITGEKLKIITEEEIRLYAYGLFDSRGQHGYHEEDWYQSICELREFYEARGFKVMLYWEVS